MVEPLRSSLRHCHHEWQVAVGHYADEYDQLLTLTRLAIGKPECVTGKVNLPFLARLVGVVIRVVVTLAVLLDILLELGVLVALRTLLRVVVIIDILHVGMPLPEPPQNLRHHQ